METLVQAKCELALSPPLAEVFPFGVTELKKSAEGAFYYRKRPIFEPKVNSLISNTGYLHLTTLEENIAGARHGRKASIQLDFNSFYDQIPLSLLVRLYFGLRWKEAYYYLKSLPMGLRVAVMVACAITWFLVSFPKKEVTTNTFVDNIRFTGEEDDVIDATLEFVRRCREVGASLDQMPHTREEARKLLEDEGDFLGVHFKYKAGLMCLTKKTTTKIELIDAASICQGPVTFKQLSVIMGLFNFSARVLLFPLWKVFHLLRRFREESSLEALFPQRTWGEREITLSKTELEELATMQRFFLQNKEISFEPPPPIDAAIFSDACGMGWGGILVWPCGKTETVSGRRGNSHGLYSSSTVSEPEGLIRVWGSLSKRGFKHATVWLDHEPLVWACRSRRPHAWHYNRALETLNSTEARSVGFVAGCRNPADYPSRGEPVPALVMEGLKTLLGELSIPMPPPNPPFMT